MRVAVITPPDPVLTWDEVRVHFRMEDDDDRQPEVMALVAAATAHIDGPAGWLGRAIGVQTLEARLDNFDCGSIRLPYPPLIEVTRVAYVDGAGGEQAVQPATYETQGSSLMPVFGAAWPSPRWQRDAVRIQYRAGYAEMPAAIRIAIILMARGMFDGQTAQDAVEGAPAALLSPLRVWR